MTRSNSFQIRKIELFAESDSFYLILEYMSGGDLHQRVVEKTRLSERVARRYVIQVLKALKYLHDNHIVHRYVHTYIHTYTYISEYLRTYIYIHTYIHTYILTISRNCFMQFYLYILYADHVGTLFWSV